MDDFDNSFSTSKAAICLRLSIGLEARSKRKRKNPSENVPKKNDSNCGMTELEFENVLVFYLCTQLQFQTKPLKCLLKDLTVLLELF